MNILETKDLKKYYGSGSQMVKALDGVSLEIKKGSFTAVVGTCLLYTSDNRYGRRRIQR